LARAVAARRVVRAVIMEMRCMVSLLVLVLRW
jgi:hypothetical protein